MPKVKLTSALAASLECEPGRSKTDYYDVATPVILEVRRSGQRTWYTRYTDGYGKIRQMKIARFGDLTFDQVKRKALQIRSEALLGGDPMAEKEARKAIATYAELAAEHLTYAKAHLRGWEGVEVNLRVHI